MLYYYSQISSAAICRQNGCKIGPPGNSAFLSSCFVLAAATIFLTNLSRTTTTQRDPFPKEPLSLSFLVVPGIFGFICPPQNCHAAAKVVLLSKV